jgi:hypothetical protein
LEGVNNHLIMGAVDRARSEGVLVSRLKAGSSFDVRRRDVTISLLTPSLKAGVIKWERLIHLRIANRIVDRS